MGALAGSAGREATGWVAAIGRRALEGQPRLAYWTGCCVWVLFTGGPEKAVDGQKGYTTIENDPGTGRCSSMKGDTGDSAKLGAAALTPRATRVGPWAQAEEPAVPPPGPIPRC